MLQNNLEANQAKIIEAPLVIPEGDYDVSNITYDANGNIQTLNRNKNTENGSNRMDELTYRYKTDKPNQLQRVDDAVTTATNANDIKDQTTENNYIYNSIGQLIENKDEHLKYAYNASGLVTEVQKNGTPRVRFYYNDRGHRIKKESILPSGTTTTYYVRDAAGTPMAIYENNVLTEHTIYGSSRLGVHYRESGTDAYQLTDHLGNVRAVIMKNGGNAVSLTAKTDYYPFGMPMPNRNVEGNYRYAFQGQEKDSETGKEAFELRLWDGRIGRWLTTDPYGQYNSPYVGMGNDPINGIDPDGGWKTKWGRFWGWVGGGFKGSFLNSENPATDYHKYGILKSSSDSNGVYFNVNFGSDAKSLNNLSGHNFDNGYYQFRESMRAYEPNLWGLAENWINDNKVLSYATGARLLYNMADDAYVYGTRNFTTSGSRHLNNIGADPKEQFNSGMNTFMTFFPSPLKGMRLTGSKFNVATFGSTFKGTFLTKLKAGTRGLVIKLTNKATDLIHGKTLLNTLKSIGETIKGN